MFKHINRFGRLIFATGVAASLFAVCASEDGVKDDGNKTNPLGIYTGENEIVYDGGGAGEPPDNAWRDDFFFEPCVVVFDTTFVDGGHSVVDAHLVCNGNDSTVVDTSGFNPPDFDFTDYEVDWGYCYRKSETADDGVECLAINSEEEFLDCRENGIWDPWEDCQVTKMRFGYCYHKPETENDAGVCLAVRDEAELADCQSREMWDFWEDCPIVKMVLSITRWCDYGPFGSKEVGFTGCWAIRNDEELAQCQAEGVGMYLDNRCTISADITE